MLNFFSHHIVKTCFALIFTTLLCNIPLAANSQSRPTNRDKPSALTGTRSEVQLPVNLSQTPANEPQRRGRPARREDGGTRGVVGTSCQTGSPRLTLLTPRNNLGLTTAAYPQFFWYAPENTARQAQFVLYRVDEKTQQETEVYTKTFNLAGKAGIASFSLPSDAGMPPLQVNQDYHWYLSLICGAEGDRTQKVVTVDGWIQRVSLSNADAAKLQQMSPTERLQFYTSRNLWYDKLATLVQLRACKSSNPQLLDAWNNLLTAERLQRVADKPLLQRCSSDAATFTPLN